jgi:ribonucleoside-triphosphate reductase
VFFSGQKQIQEADPFYSNSVHFAVNAPIDYIYRLKEQSKFHQFIEAGSMIHNWIGDRKPDPKALFNLIEKVWNNTKCAEMTISPDKTTCLGCENTYSGFHTSCPNCQSDNVFWTTRITGYQVRVDKFNNAKLAELHDRKRENI